MKRKSNRKKARNDANNAAYIPRILARARITRRYARKRSGTLG
jgi:hypothetical protein